MIVIGTETETVIETATAIEIETGESRGALGPAALPWEGHDRWRGTSETETGMGSPPSTQTGHVVVRETAVPSRQARQRRIHSLACPPLDAAEALCVAAEEAVEETGRQTEVGRERPTMTAATDTLEAVLRKGAGAGIGTIVIVATGTPTPTSDATPVTNATAETSAI